MNATTIDRIGRILKNLQVDKINQFLSAKDYIRVTVSHYVKKGEEQNFEDIIRYFRDNYEIIGPQELFSCLEGKKPLQGKKLLMTFDDGLKSSCDAAKNILSKFNIKAIFFIPTMILELKSPKEMRDFFSHYVYYNEVPTGGLTEEEYIAMTKEDIVDLHHQGHMILPHTHTHCRLIDIRDPATAETELVKPKQILEGLLKESPRGFAFPIGTERVVSSYSFSCIQREYQYCFSALAGKNTLKTNPYFLHRDCIHAHYSLAHVQSMTQGVFDGFYHFKMLRLKKRFIHLRKKPRLFSRG